MGGRFAERSFGFDHISRRKPTCHHEWVDKKPHKRRVCRSTDTAKRRRLTRWWKTPKRNVFRTGDRMSFRISTVRRGDSQSRRTIAVSTRRAHYVRQAPISHCERLLGHTKRFRRTCLLVEKMSVRKWRNQDFSKGKVALPQNKPYAFIFIVTNESDSTILFVTNGKDMLRN